ncbi:MAG TPA: antibiotic biosynthesis monooxygenase [Xanthobacteraceae bacterium]|jgi:quinol monooxygenase YgiN
MRLLVSALLAAASTCLLAGAPVQAQDAAMFVVSYIETAPDAASTAAGLLRQYADSVRKQPGNVRFEPLQRVARSGQFAIVAGWKDRSAYDTHVAASDSIAFRDKIKPHLISAIDDRLHSGMDVVGAATANAAGAVHVVTHVDVPPPSKDDCISLLRALAGESRKEAGVARFEVLQQSSRPNHFTVVEIWRDEDAYNRHITAAHTKNFRERLTPMSGALYDERLYKPL